MGRRWFDVFFVGLAGGRPRLRNFGGAHAHSGLLEVSLESFDGDRAVFRCVGVGEAWPGRVVACFDGGYPGRFDWEACGGVKVSNECADAG